MLICLKTLLILVISMQMFFATTAYSLEMLSRESVDISKESIEKFQKEIEDFRVLVSGKEDCKEEEVSSEDEDEDEDEDETEDLFEIDEDFDFEKLTEKLVEAKISSITERQKALTEEIIKEKENACSLSVFKQKPKKTEKCEKTPGLIDHVIKDIMEIEKVAEEEDEDLSHQITSKVLKINDYKKYAAQALKLKIDLEMILDNVDVAEEVRRELAYKFIGSVIWPLREFTVVISHYVSDKEIIKNMYERLLFRFPTDLFPEDSEDNVRKKLIDGPKSSVDPFHLKVKEDEGHRSRIYFDSVNAVQRDIMALMKAPTMKNYLRASKWLTIQMMLAQYTIYTSMIKDERKISEDVKKACFKRDNGGFEDNIEFKYFKINGDPMDGESYMTSILKGHGLISAEAYDQYYYKYVNKDPNKEGYSGLVPFEKYKFAKIGYERPRIPKEIEPAIDDYSDFNDVMDIKLGRALSIFNTKRRDTETGDKVDFEYRGKELVTKMIYAPSEDDQYGFIDDEDKLVTLDVEGLNLTSYLAERMEREKKKEVKDIIPEHIKNKLKKNIVKVRFPSLYSSVVWRDYGVTKLYEVLKNNKYDRNFRKKILPFLARACTKVAQNNQRELKNITDTLCEGLEYRHNPALSGYGYSDRQKGDPRKQVESTESYHLFIENLEKLIRSDLFIPGIRIDEKKYEHLWIGFASLWDDLRDGTNQMPFAKYNEYEFIMEQMEVGNPWVRARLSYLLLVDELRIEKNTAHENVGEVDFKHAVSTKCDKPEYCYFRLVSSKLRHIKKAGKYLLLTKIQEPHFASEYLSKNEKKYLWKDTIQRTNDFNSQLFSVKAHDKLVVQDTKEDEGYVDRFFSWAKERLNKEEEAPVEDYYNKLEHISYQNFFTEEKVDHFIADYLDNDISSERQDELNSIFNSKLGRYGQTLKSIYDMKGDVDAQRKEWHYFLKNNTDIKGMHAKEAFFKLDSFIKEPIYKDLMSKSAKQRRNDLEYALVDICNTGFDEHEKLQTVFYSTMKSQNRLNQMIGIPGLQNKVMDKMSSMSPEEWTDMKLSLAMMGLIMGTVAFGAACTTLSMGACAPLSVGMIASAVGGYTIQYGLFQREYARYKKGNEYAKTVKRMEEMGMTDLDSHDNLERTIFWTGIEATGLIAFLGPLVRSSYLGTRFMNLMMKNWGKLSKPQFQALARQAIREVDTKFALDVLEFKKYGQKFGVDEYKLEVGKSYQKVRHNFKRLRDGDISPEKFLKSLQKLLKKVNTLPRYMAKGVTNELAGEVTVKVTKDQADQQLAQVIPRYWNNNPKALLNNLNSFIDGSFMRKGLNEAKAKIARGGLTSKYTGWRFKYLVDNEKEVLKLRAKLRKMIDDGNDFDLFVEENADLICKVYSRMPMRKREFIHMFLFQGGPHLSGNLGRRIPGLYQVADGLMMRKFVNARNRLIIENLSRESRKLLGLSASVASEVSYEAMGKFYKSLDKLKAKKSVSKKALKEFETMFDDLQVEVSVMVKDIFDNTLTSGKFKKVIDRLFSKKARMIYKNADLTDEQIKRLMFNLDDLTPEEKVLSQLIWQHMPLEQIFNLNPMQKLTHEVVEDLAKEYKNIDEFAELLNALKIQLYKKSELLLEYM